MALVKVMIGAFEPRKYIVVDASSLDDAYDKARIKLDEEYEKEGLEPPVAWDLEVEA